MLRVYCHMKDDIVEQIFDIDKEPYLIDELTEDTFTNFYMIDTDRNDIDYSYRYNKELQDFEKNPNYVEVDNIIEPSKEEIIKELQEENQELKNRLKAIEQKLGL